MEATIESTDRIVEISDPSGRRATARVWEGVTEAGILFTVYFTQVQVRAGGGRSTATWREVVLRRRKQ